MEDYSWGIYGEFSRACQFTRMCSKEKLQASRCYLDLGGETWNGDIYNNDLRNVGYSVDGPFKILLGPGTVNYKVVTDEPDIVLDLGTDNTVNERPRRGQ